MLESRLTMILGFLSKVKRLHPSPSIKYLGVALDSDLSWKSQINNVAAKLKGANGALAKIHHFVPTSSSSTGLLCDFPFTSTILLPSLGQPSSVILHQIGTLQYCAMKLMAFKSPRDSANKLYANLRVIKFSDMVNLQNFLFLDKQSRDEMPEPIQRTFTVDFAAELLLCV